MFVNSLFCSYPELCREETVSADDIESAIRRLDATQFSEVSLARKKTESYMSIFGGRGHYVVSATLNGDIFGDTLNPDADSDVRVSLGTGGQTTTLGLDKVVDLELEIYASLL